MTRPTWLWETSDDIREAYLEVCLRVLNGEGQRSYSPAYMAAAMDWALRERYRASRWRQAYRVLLGQVARQARMELNHPKAPPGGTKKRGKREHLDKSGSLGRGSGKN